MEQSKYTKLHSKIGELTKGGKMRENYDEVQEYAMNNGISYYVLNLIIKANLNASDREILNDYGLSQLDGEVLDSINIDSMNNKSSNVHDSFNSNLNVSVEKQEFINSKDNLNFWILLLSGIIIILILLVLYSSK